MITKKDCTRPVCFVCKEKFKPKEVCFVISKTRLLFDQSKYEDSFYLKSGYWKATCSDPATYANILFHEQCFLAIAGEGYQFDSGSKEDPIILMP